MLGEIELKKVNFSITKFQRITDYIEDLEKNIKIKKEQDKRTISNIKNLIEEKITHIKRLYIVSYLLYFGIYFSFFSIFFSKVIFLSEFANFVTKVLGFFGTTVFIIGVFFVNKIIDLYYQDLNLLTSHLISIFMTNQINHENLFKDENDFNVFIDFFKKRGF